MGARVKTSRDAFSQTLLASDFIEVGKIVLWLRGSDVSDERHWGRMMMEEVGRWCVSSVSEASWEAGSNDEYHRHRP
jgi:hypothetical protein